MRNNVVISVVAPAYLLYPVKNAQRSARLLAEMLYKEVVLFVNSLQNIQHGGMNNGVK